MKEEADAARPGKIRSVRNPQILKHCLYFLSATVYISVFVCVCVCVRERERESVCVCVCVRVHDMSGAYIHIVCISVLYTTPF